jgi:hypothetical protein
MARLAEGVPELLGTADPLVDDEMGCTSPEDPSAGNA